MVLRALFTGVGEFGKRLGLSLYEFILNNRGVDDKVSTILVCDLYTSDQWEKELEKRGFESGLLEANRIKTKLEYHMIVQPKPDVATIQAGVGKFWPLSARYAAEYYSMYEERVKKRLEMEGGNISLFVIAGSSGGGTGCGTVPEWARLLFPQIPAMLGVQGTHVFTPTATVLPFRDEYHGISELNAAAFLGRIFPYSKTILLADNEAVRSSRNLTIDETKNEVNRKLTLALFSLLLASPPLEAADLNLLFGVGGRASIAVPAVRAFPMSYLNRWRPELAIRETLLYEPLSGISAENPTGKLLVLALYPSGQSLNIRENIENIVEPLYWVNRVHFEPIATPYLRDTFIIAVFFIDPYVPRLKELYQKLKSHIADETRLREYIRSMLTTVPAENRGELAYFSEEAMSVIMQAQERYEEFIQIYTRELGFSNPGNPSNPNGGGFTTPLRAVSELPAEPPLHSRKLRSVRVTVQIHELEWDGVIKEFEDRSVSETIETLLTLLVKDKASSGDALQDLVASIHENPSEAIQENLEVLVSIRGVEVPLPPDVLRMSLSEYPPIDRIVAKAKEELWREIVCPKCGETIRIAK